MGFDRDFQRERKDKNISCCAVETGFVKGLKVKKDMFSELPMHYNFKRCVSTYLSLTERWNSTS